jgi:hypothetical protein
MATKVQQLEAEYGIAAALIMPASTLSAAFGPKYSTSAASDALDAYVLCHGQVGPAECRPSEQDRNQGNSGLARALPVKPMGLFRRANTKFPNPAIPSRRIFQSLGSAALSPLAKAYAAVAPFLKGSRGGSSQSGF